MTNFSKSDFIVSWLISIEYSHALNVYIGHSVKRGRIIIFLLKGEAIEYTLNKMNHIPRKRTIIAEEINEERKVLEH